MKVLYITDTYEIGGAFLAFLELVESIADNHSDIIPVILSSEDGKNNEFARKRGIENYSVGHKAFTINNGSTLPRKVIRFFMRPILRVRYELANKKAIKLAETRIDFSNIDIIHSNSNRNDLGALLAQKYGIPHVWHLRECADDCFSLKRDYIKYMNEHCDCFIAISHAVANAWIERGIQADKVQVIYDGVKPALTIKDKKNGNITRGVIAGFISPFKGQYNLIKSLNIIKNELNNKFQLDVYGHAAFEYLIKLKIYLFFHGLQDMVKIKGYIDSVDKLFADYDIGFMCSKDEGFGRVTAEYMMNGLCVIASNTGANQEIIKDGTNGYIYRYKDNADLANTIKSVLENPRAAILCAEQGRRDAVNLYTCDKNADNVSELYYKICGSTRFAD